MSEVIIRVAGGQVQDICTDSQDISITILDYEDDHTNEAPSVYPVPVSHHAPITLDMRIIISASIEHGGDIVLSRSDWDNVLAYLNLNSYCSTYEIIEKQIANADSDAKQYRVVFPDFKTFYHVFNVLSNSDFGECVLSDEARPVVTVKPLSL